MTEQEALLSSILANPEDDLPRLAYADWLAEHGDPQGEFVRVQMGQWQLKEWLRENRVPPKDYTHLWTKEDDKRSAAAARINRLQARSLEILDETYTGRPWCREIEITESVLKNRMAWAGPLLAAVTRRVVYRRGLVHKVFLWSFTDWRDHGREIVLDHPVLEVEIVGAEPYSTVLNGQSRSHWFPEGVVTEGEPAVENATLPLWIWPRLVITATQARSVYNRTSPPADANLGTVEQEHSVEVEVQLLRHGPRSQTGVRRLTFSSRQAAADCLSASLVGWARRRAKLPRLDLAAHDWALVS